MELTRGEKYALIFLSTLLLVGSILLYARHSRPLKEITIVKNGVKEELTLQEVELELKESRRVDINTASKEELTNIPGIGDTLAERIIERRGYYGKFYSSEGLLEIEGIGPQRLEKIKEYIKVE
ncbi:ComEA family DNA-binding protein [Candidatus Omnitrophota bacterium]